jgi:polyhydroxyalkanoate synthesis regulator phasin
VIRAQQTPPAAPGEAPAEPRRIEILQDDDAVPDPETQAVENLRDQITQLQEELRRLRDR